MRKIWFTVAAVAATRDAQCKRPVLPRLPAVSASVLPASVRLAKRRVTNHR